MLAKLALFLSALVATSSALVAASPAPLAARSKLSPEQLQDMKRGLAPRNNPETLYLINSREGDKRESFMIVR